MGAVKVLDRGGLPMVAASAVNADVAVRVAASGNTWSVVACSTSAQEPLGVSMASAPNPGDAVTVQDDGNIPKVTAAASLGAGADVMVGSSNGALAPANAPVGSGVWLLGKSLSPAAAGEKFSLYVRPRQVT